MDKYPLPLPNPYKPYVGLQVYNEEQYDIVAHTLSKTHGISDSVALAPKRNKDTKLIELDEFPVILQVCWMPWCGEHIRCWNKNVKHYRYVEMFSKPKDETNEEKQ